MHEPVQVLRDEEQPAYVAELVAEYRRGGADPERLRELRSRVEGDLPRCETDWT